MGKRSVASKSYQFDKYKVNVNYLNEKSIKEYLNESIEISFIPKVMEEISKKK